MARPKKSVARTSRALQRSSGGPASQLTVSKRVNIAVKDIEDKAEDTIKKLRIEANSLQDAIRLAVSAAMRDIPIDTLERPFLEVLGEAESAVEDSEQQSAAAVWPSGKNTTATTAISASGKKVSKAVRSKAQLQSTTRNLRPSRSTARATRTPTTSSSVPPKGVITPKFDTSECRRGRTPSLTRKAKPGEVLVSLSGSPVRSENRLQDKAAAIITLGNGKVISIAPDTDMKQCKVGKDALARLQALQQTITKIVKNNKRP